MANLFSFRSGIEDITSSINQIDGVSEANAIVSEELANETIGAVTKDVQLLEDSVSVVENTAEMIEQEAIISDELEANGSVESYRQRAIEINNFIANQCGVLGIGRNEVIRTSGLESFSKDPIMQYQDACEGLKDFFTKIKDAVVKFFRKVWDGIKNFWKWLTTASDDEYVDVSEEAKEATEEEIKEFYEENKGQAIKAVVAVTAVRSGVVLNEFFLHITSALSDLLSKLKDLLSKGVEAVKGFVKKACGFIRRSGSGNASNGGQIQALVETEVVEAEVVEPLEIENKISKAAIGLGKAHSELKKLGLTPSICGIAPDESNIKEIPALVDLGPSDPVVINVYGDENNISSADFIFKTNDSKCPFVIWHNLIVNVDDGKAVKFLHKFLKENNKSDDDKMNKLIKSLETQMNRLEKSSNDVVKQLEYVKSDETAVSQVSSTAVSVVTNGTKTLTTMVKNSRQSSNIRKKFKAKQKGKLKKVK